ncbi:MAG: glutaredoxin [Myxococcota bacterium]|nr:glutaredoxin [Myxococcota bacterium]
MTDTPPRVILYSTSFCGYCVAAKRMLERDGIPFEEIDLSSNPQQRMELVAETGWRTMPLILIDGELLGGYTELMARRSNQGLEDLL